MEKREKKLTYEELEGIVHQLSEQARSLSKRLEETNMFNLFKRLDYLFKVLDNKSCFEYTFIESVVKEIQESLTLVEPETTPEQSIKK